MIRVRASEAELKAGEKNSAPQLNLDHRLWSKQLDLSFPPFKTNKRWQEGLA